MPYLVPFSRIKALLNLKDDAGPVVGKFDDFCDVFRHLVSAAPVDETWYATAYPDAAASRLFGSASEHFANLGYFAGWLPYERETAERRYPLSFSAAKRLLTAIPTRRSLVVKIDHASFRTMLRGLLAAVPVDARWYLETYPDVAAAVAAGKRPSAAHHFAEAGYFEGRLPYEMAVDEDWYVNAYPDLRRVRSGDSRLFGASTLPHGRLPGRPAADAGRSGGAAMGRDLTATP